MIDVARESIAFYETTHSQLGCDPEPVGPRFEALMRAAAAPRRVGATRRGAETRGQSHARHLRERHASHEQVRRALGALRAAIAEGDRRCSQMRRRLEDFDSREHALRGRLERSHAVDRARLAARSRENGRER